MHSAKDSSAVQKSILTFIHFVALAFSAWILFGQGDEFIFEIFGKAHNQNADLNIKMVFFFVLASIFCACYLQALFY